MLTAISSSDVTDFNLTKNTVDYETDWIEISDDQVPPFYRENQQEQMKCLYSDKCWIDLKFFPVQTSNTLKPRLKLIFLLLQSEEWNCFTNSKNGSIESKKLDPSQSPLTTRLLTIQTKFLLSNKTSKDFKFELLSQNVNAVGRDGNQQFIGLNEYESIASKGYFATGEIVNVDTDQNGVKEAIENPIDEEFFKKYCQIDEKINDLFYFKINEISDETSGMYQINLDF